MSISPRQTLARGILKAEIPATSITVSPQATATIQSSPTRVKNLTSRYGVFRLVQTVATKLATENAPIVGIGKSHVIYLGDEKIAADHSSYAIMDRLYPINDQPVLIYPSGPYGSGCYDYVQAISLSKNALVKFFLP